MARLRRSKLIEMFGGTEDTNIRNSLSGFSKHKIVKLWYHLGEISGLDLVVIVVVVVVHRATASCKRDGF